MKILIPIPYIKFVVSLKCKCEKISHNIKSLWAPEYFCSNVNTPITSAPLHGTIRFEIRFDCNACVLAAPFLLLGLFLHVNINSPSPKKITEPPSLNKGSKPHQLNTLNRKPIPKPKPPK